MSNHPINLILLYGGQTQEHEVSLHSAASVLANLDAEKYNIIPIAIDKNGHYYVHEYRELLSYSQKLPVVTPQAKPLDSLLTNGKLALDASVIFPVLHGTLYEDGCLQGLMELAAAAYVGSDVLSSALGMDKDMARRVVCNNGIKSTKYATLSWHVPASMREQKCLEITASLKWPLFVKPCSSGSSVGIRKVNDFNQLLDAVNDALRYDKEVLIEEYVVGREIELAVLEHAELCGKPRVSVPGEIRVRHQDGFYSYCAKYIESEETDLIIPAVLSDELTHKLQAFAADIFTQLKCRGMARVDFFVDDKTNEIYFSEINTLPGFTSISMYPKLWEATGISYSALLDELILIALRHRHCRQQLVTNYL